MLSGNLSIILISLMAAVSVSGIAVAIFYPKITGTEQSDKRLAGISTGRNVRNAKESVADQSQNRRKHVQETLKQLDDKQKAKRKRIKLKTRITQAGISISVRTFWVLSFFTGLLIALVLLVTGTSLPLSAGAGFIGMLGLPRWVLAYMKKRRQAKFLSEFVNGIDIIVRGVKSGLPVNDSFKIVAREISDPVGPEFDRVIEGQRLGIPLAEGLERMYERMPLAEVNFLSIVISIQAQTGGNLAEALGNLATVLRDRKKMQAKIQAVSQEAKASAGIIGALPIVVMVLVYLSSPDYITLLWTDQLGQVMLVGCGLWMSLGVAVMRKMINFDF